MTHAPPDDRELANLNKWIDRHIKTDYLQHKHRIGDLLNTQMIARSVVEHLFLCRVLSIHAQTKVLSGLTGARLESVLDTDSLNISYGTIERKLFVGITANNCRHMILRGDYADTYAEAMVSFIDTVLDTSVTYQSEMLQQKAETDGSASTAAQIDAAHATRRPLPALVNPSKRPYTPYTLQNAMPSLLPSSSSYTKSYAHNIQQYSLDDQATRLRRIHYIVSKVTKPYPDDTALLVIHISNVLVRMKRIGEFGLGGIQSAEDVFIGVGYEGTNCYMGIMVNAPGAGPARTVLKGNTM